MVAVRGEVENLEEMAPGWGDLYPDEQTDFEIDWLNAMAHLRSLERMRGAGELTDRSANTTRSGAALPNSCPR